LQLRSLRLFLAVARLGSFVAAASRENTVQSNVTAHVKKLEAELGVRLFDRRSGDLWLTPAGRRLLGQAEAICRLHDDAVDELTGRGAPRGTLRIGTMETTAAVRLPPVLTAFHRTHPEVDVVLSTGPTADLLEWLRAGDLDGAYRRRGFRNSAASTPSSAVSRQGWAMPFCRRGWSTCSPTAMRCMRSNWRDRN